MCHQEILVKMNKDLCKISKDKMELMLLNNQPRNSIMIKDVTTIKCKF